MAVPFTKAISGNPYKHRGGTVFNGGAIATDANAPVTNALTIRNSAYEDGKYGSSPFLAVSPTSSGNVGTTKALSSGQFAKMEANYYVGKIIGSRIAGTSNTVLQSGAGQFHRRAINFSESYRRLNITSWNYATGAATKGGNAGDSTSVSADHAARPTSAIPGELVYMETGLIPTQDDYQPRTG